MNAPKKLGRQSLGFANPPYILTSATVVGPKEGAGPLGKTFDLVAEDLYFGCQSWEKAERKFLEEAVYLALNKLAMTSDQVDFLLAGDLLNQTISANFAAGKLGIPFLGLYGACSTMYEGMALASMLIDGGFAQNVIAAVSSHYASAERQYRFPTEQGVQRPPSAQWTATGGAAFMLAAQGQGPRVTQITIGKVVDMGIKDPADMGSAMAPAAVDTMVRHFQDTGTSPASYDLIVTGDLGRIGKELAIRLAAEKGYDLKPVYDDCGVMLYAPEQDVHAGGSGCACSAVVTGGEILSRLIKGELKRVLGVGTGALLSPVSSQQGESIPCIGHAVVLEA